MNLSINFLMSRFLHENSFAVQASMANRLADLFALLAGLLLEIFAVKNVPFPAPLGHVA